MKNNPLELIDDLKVIRTIHSNKARLFGLYNFWYTIVTILIAVIVTFIGFSGAENFAKLFVTEHDKSSLSKPAAPLKDSTYSFAQGIKQDIDSVKQNMIFAADFSADNLGLDFKAKVKMIMDLMTLSILVISILGLILQFEKKTNNHNSAVLKLTELISDLSFNYSTVAPAPQLFKQEDVKVYAEKYKALINSLPSSTDKDYFFALRTIKRKKKKKKFISSEEYGKMSFIKRRWKMLWM